MNYVIPPAAVTSLTVAGIAERFPVNRIFCVGRNYAAHAREMGKDPDRDPPFFFMKPANAAVDAASPVSIPYPPQTANFHHEIELVVAIGKGVLDLRDILFFLLTIGFWLYASAVVIDLKKAD